MKKVISVILSISSIIALYYYLGDEYSSVLKKSNIYVHLLVLSLILPSKVLTAYENHIVLKKNGMLLKTKEWVLLHFVRGFWSLVIPLQGGIVFSTYYFKKKFKISLTSSLFLNIFLLLITLSFSGLACFIMLAVTQAPEIKLWSFSILLFLNPFLTFIALKTIGNIPIKKWNFQTRINYYFESLYSSLKDLWSDWKYTLQILIIKFSAILIETTLFYQMSSMLNLGLDFAACILISIIASVSLVFKFTPGNIGVSQLFTGIFFAWLGGLEKEAVFVSLYVTVANSILNLIIGSIGNFLLVGSFNLKKS